MARSTSSEGGTALPVARPAAHPGRGSIARRRRPGPSGASPCRRRRLAGRAAGSARRVSRASSTRRTDSSTSATSSRTPGASCRSRSSSPSRPSATAAAWPACSCGRARKPAAKAGRARTSPPSAGSPRRTGPRAHSRPMPAGGSMDACARRSAPGPERSISTSTASAPRPPRWIRRCATRSSSAARSRRPTGRSHPSRRGRSACAMSMPTWIRSCATTPPLGGLPVEPRVKVSAPTAVLEFDTRDNLFTPTEGVYAETSYLASREALGASKDFERFEQVVMGWLPLPNRDHARGACELRLVVERDAVLPAALHPAAGRSGDALSGRQDGLRRGGGALAGLRPLERRRLRRRRHGPDRSRHFEATQNVGSGGVGFRYTLAREFGMDVGLDVARSSGDDGGVSRGGQRLVPAVIGLHGARQMGPQR